MILYFYTKQIVDFVIALCYNRTKIRGTCGYATENEISRRNIAVYQ